MNLFSQVYDHFYWDKMNQECSQEGEIEGILRVKPDRLWSQRHWKYSETERCLWGYFSFVGTSTQNKKTNSAQSCWLSTPRKWWKWGFLFIFGPTDQRPTQHGQVLTLTKWECNKASPSQGYRVRGETAPQQASISTALNPHNAVSADNKVSSASHPVIWGAVRKIWRSS